LQTFSQKKDKSASFDEPAGDSYVLQLKNGNTFYMEITKKEGIKILLFDTLRKKIPVGKLDSKLIGDKIGYHISEGVFEIKGDVAIFLQVAEEKRTPILVRIIVDGKTGKIKFEEKISELERIKGGAGYAILVGGVDLPDFNVIKDPESDYYALIRYNTLAEETKDRIEVIHYNPDHKVINRANYLAPDNQFKYTRYLNAYVNKDNYVVVATYAFNTKKTGGEEARLYISQLSKGKSGFKQQEMPYKDFYKNVECAFEYNKTKQLIHMSFMTGAKAKGNAIIRDYHFQNINPGTLKADNIYEPDFSQVNEYYKETMVNKKDFKGILNKTAIDKSGNMILFFQEKTVVTSSGTGNSMMATTKTYYGDVAILTVSPAGKTIGSAVFPCNMLGSGGSFSMAMVATDNNTYILFNNSVDNMDRPEAKEAKAIKALGIMVPVKYTYNGSVVKKEYLFKQPKEKKGNPYCDFSVSHYNPLTKKYAVMYIDPEKDKVCLMYVTL